MRFAVGRIPADRLSKPIGRGIGVLVEPIRVPEVEEVIGLTGIELGRLSEEEGCLARLRRRAAPQLHDADRVGDDGERRAALHGAQHAIRFFIALEANQRHRRGEAALALEKAARADAVDGVERALMFALLGMQFPEGQPHSVVLRRRPQCPIEERSLG